MQEISKVPIQINYVRPNPYVVLDGGNLHVKYRDFESSSHELFSFWSYQPFTWDEGIIVANMYQIVFF